MHANLGKCSYNQLNNNTLTNRVYWCILDGADTNRQFVKIHFADVDPAEKFFTTNNIYTDDPMIFIMDPKVMYECVKFVWLFRCSLTHVLYSDH